MPPPSLRQSFAWSFVQQFGQYALQFVGMVVIARLLDPEEIGVFLLAVAINLMLGGLREMGLGTYLIREPVLSEIKIRTVYGLSIVVSTGFALLLVACVTPLAALYDTPGIAEAMGPIALSVLLSPIGAPAQALLTREMHFQRLAAAVLGAKAVGVGLGIALALSGFSYMALAWGALAEAIVRAGVLIALRPDHLRLRPSLAGWRQVLNFGGWVTAASLVGLVAAEGLKFVIGFLNGTAAVAFYDRAIRLPLIARQALFVPVARVLLPSFSRDLREGVAIGPKVLSLCAFSGVLVWPLFLVLGLLAEPLVLLLFGPGWEASAAILPWLLAANALSVLLPQPDQILVPHGRVKRLFGVRLVQFCSSIGLAVLGASFGLLEFAVLRLLDGVIFLVTTWVALRAYLGVDLATLARAHALSAVIALGAVVPLAAAIFLGDGGFGLGVLGGLGLVAPLWLLGLSLGGHPLWGELMRLSRGVRTRLGV
ncbi:MAG: oligosaccharide flippase family protein [Pseudomonadota bacterium]